MGYEPNSLPPNFRRRMPATEPLSLAAQEKRITQADVRLEKQLHDQFMGWLRINEWPFVHSRMDRKSTIAEGWPDFTVVKNGRVAMVEFKVGSNTLSDEQEKVIASLRQSGTPVCVTGDLGEAIGWVQEQLRVET